MSSRLVDGLMQLHAVERLGKQRKNQVLDAPIAAKLAKLSPERLLLEEPVRLWLGRVGGSNVISPSASITPRRKTIDET
jgi:hypothetical protein